MSAVAPVRVDEAIWSASLLSADSELLLGAARNYLGPVRTPYDKREIVGRLAAFLRRPEVREAIVGLLDELDARVLGIFWLLGPLPEAELRILFEGDLPLFDLGIRVANLQDRLLLFRFEAGGRRLLALNPVLAEDLRAILSDPSRVFGRRKPVEEGRVALAPATAKDCLALFLFLFHLPGGIRKGGALTKKAQEKLGLLLPQFASAPERLSSLVHAFQAGGLLGAGAEGREADPGAFAAALEAWGEDLPAWLAACLAKGVDPGLEGRSRPGAEVLEAGAVLAAALEASPEGFAFSRGGFGRWLEVVQRRARRGLDLAPALARADLVDALVALGLLVEEGEDLRVCLAWARGDQARPASEDGQGPLVAEGSHALHIMPEGSLEDRLFVGRLARLTVAGTVWTYEVDRDSARRSFAAGTGATEALEGLARLGGRALPQSLSFSLKAWEEEYRALRLYRGFVLVADERLRPVVEASRTLAPRIAERLAPGIYVLAVSGPEEAAALIEEAGLEAPPETRSQTGLDSEMARYGSHSAEEGVAPRARQRARTAAQTLEEARRGGSDSSPDGGDVANSTGLDPRPRLEALLAGLAASPAGPGDGTDFSDARPKPGRGPAELKEMADRIERRLILTPRQLEVAEVRLERMEATGLDYLGKVRIVERALRSQGDRLEILYRLPGEDPCRVLVRPVRLEKAEKGLILEAEDLGSGGPIRIPLGAASSVRRMRASLFGEEA